MTHGGFGYAVGEPTRSMAQLDHQPWEKRIMELQLGIVVIGYIYICRWDQLLGMMVFNHGYDSDR